MPVLIRSTENLLTHQAPLRTFVRTPTWFADLAVARGLGERKEAEAKPDRESALCVRSAALPGITGGPQHQRFLVCPFCED